MNLDDNGNPIATEPQDDKGADDNAFGSQVARDRLDMLAQIAGDEEEEPASDEGEKPEVDEGESDEAKALRSQADEAAPPPAKKHTLKVDGQEQEVDEEAVIKAGLAALQKESTADRRLEEATRLLNEAKQARPAPSPTPAPTVDPDAIRKIQYGSAEEASVALQELLAKNSAGIKPQDVQQIVHNETKRAAVQTQFKTEYPHVFNDPDLMDLAAKKLDARLRAGEPNEYATYAAVGKELSEKFKLASAAASETTTPGGEFTDKLGKKRDVVRVPVASGKVGTQPKVDKEESVADVIGEIRKARKQS